MSAVETFLIAAAVAGALFYLGRAAWRRWRGDGSCRRCAAAQWRPAPRPGPPSASGS